MKVRQRTEIDREFREAIAAVFREEKFAHIRKHYSLTRNVLGKMITVEPGQKLRLQKAAAEDSECSIKVIGGNYREGLLGGVCCWWEWDEITQDWRCVGDEE
jgi:hypothetical protein